MNDHLNARTRRPARLVWPAVLLSASLLAPAAAADRAQLSFANAEIDAVARAVASISGKNVVVDPRVKGTMTLMSNGLIKTDQALRLFGAQLKTQGLALVEVGGIFTVVPEADARLQSGPVSVGRVSGGAGQIVTQIFRLNHESAASLVPVLRPLISQNNTINVNSGTNSLVITDYADNLHRISKIIATLDVAQGTGVEVIRLRHGIAPDVAAIVQRMLDTSPPAAAAAAAGAAPAAPEGGTRTIILPDARANALIVRAANPARLSLVRAIVAQLDMEPATGSAASSGNIHVVYLKNADATRLAATLRGGLSPGGNASPNTAGSPAGTAVAAGGGSASAPAQSGGMIQADPSSNALIINAPEPVYRQLRDVIDKLDQRRAQVYIESLIAEISEDKAAEFGVQWQGLLGNNGNVNVGAIGTNFKIGGVNLLSLAKGITDSVLPSPGINFGVGHKQNGTYVLGFLARMLQSQGGANVLSTPTILTLDNEEAKIVIGQNVPFVTGQFTNGGTGAGGAVNPFQTIERRDVGLTLRVRPQINEAGTIKLQIYQEVSRIDSNSTSGLITNKRSIESNVLVEDGSVVALGGLLQDDQGNSVEKIPLLGDVPVLGALFRSEARSRKKTNLMVFLRPVVMRSAQATESFSLDRYELMRSDQESLRNNPSVVVPVDTGAVLPPLRPEVRSRLATSTAPAAPAASTRPVAPASRTAPFSGEQVAR